MAIETAGSSRKSYSSLEVSAVERGYSSQEQLKLWRSKRRGPRHRKAKRKK
jgi:hypothetical protein